MEVSRPTKCSMAWIEVTLAPTPTLIPTLTLICGQMYEELGDMAQACTRQHLQL